MTASAQVATVTAIVGGFPPNLRRAQPLPGETLLQLAVRNHPREWRNFVESLERDHSLPQSLRATYLRGQIGPAERGWSAQIQEFFNQHLPSHRRTLGCLATLRDALNGPELSGAIAVRIVEIIFPGQRNPKPGAKDPMENIAKELDIKVDWRDPADAEQGILRPSIVAQVHGDFIWIVSGGTYFNEGIAALGLGNLLRQFEERPRMAYCSCKRYSEFFRTSSVKAIAASSGTLPSVTKELVTLIERHGYEWSAVEGSLAELEPVYGGEEGVSQAISRDIRRGARKRSWWQKLLRLR